METPPAPLGAGSRHGRSEVLALSAVIAAALHFGELGQFLALAESARPEWLLLAIVAQAATYCCQAAVWHGEPLCP